jgi:minimal PKS ketosynthase (KS/KS alpha)
MRRTAVTGVGVVAPGGVTRDRFWAALIAGRSAIRHISFFSASGFRSQIAAECDFDPYVAGLDDQEMRRMDRYVELGVAAAMEAVSDSALDLQNVDRDAMAVSMGSALGGVMYLEEDYVVASRRGATWLVDSGYASPFLYHAALPSSLASEVSLKFGAHGPSVVHASSCTAGIDAVGFGHQLIQDGEAEIVVAGAAESPISPIVIGGLDPIKATSHRNDDPSSASRPFDRERDGFVVGEGAAVLVLEEWEHAAARGAHVYCEVAAYANLCTAHHMTGLKADGLDLAETMTCALRQANLRAQDVDYISAHGTSTKQNDRHETAAFKHALGEHAFKVPISSIKSMIGYALGASGALQLAACALAIEQGVIPPTINLHNPDPECDLDYVPNEARYQRVDVALATASGFGGFQAAAILSRGSDATRSGLPA